jgi:pimeloyl-ACP methyl ester carboxylesterase
VARNLGIFMLILVLGAGLGISTYIVLELGGMETVSSYLTDMVYINAEEKNAVQQSADVNAFTEKGIDYGEGKHTINVKEDIMPAISRAIHTMLEIPSRIAFGITDDYYSSNITLIWASEQTIGSVGTDYYEPLFYMEKFAVYSPQLGVIDSYQMEVMQNFTPSASESKSNPLGADTSGIVRNSQLQIKRRLVMQPGETDNFKLIYTLKNLGGPYFKDKTKLAYINVGTEMLAPAFADIDGDGDLDMLVGDAWGRVYYYKNTGNRTDFNFILDDSPVNSSDSNLFSGVSVTGCNIMGCSISPTFADLDDDGDYDLVLARADNYYLKYYQNTGTSTNPLWQEGGLFYFLNGTYTYDTDFADFDNDGDLDMIAVQSSRSLSYYENIGSASAPTWSLAWNYTFDAFSEARGAEATDFDGDGDYDVLVGDRGYASPTLGVKLFENTGTASSPSFKLNNNFTIDPGAIMPAGTGSTHGFSYIENFGMGAADLDGDGDDDLVLGNSNGTLTYYEKKYDKIEDLYFYEIPFMDIYDASYNGTVSYDKATDSFIVSLSNPDSTLVIYGDKASSKHGIQGNRWLHPWAWHMYGDPCLESYPLGEDLYWTDGELNGLDRYTTGAGESYSCNSNSYNTSQQVAPVLGFSIGDLDVGEEKEITITYRFALGKGARTDPDLSIENIGFLGDNVSFDVVNTGVEAATPMVKLVEYSDGEVVKSTEMTLNSGVKDRLTVNVAFKVDNKHTVAVIADPLNKIVETDENNNMLEKQRKKYNVYLDISMGSLNDAFKEYLLSKLVNYNVVNDLSSADYVIYIGGEAYNNETLDKGFGIDGYAKWYSKKGFYPYNGFVNVLDDRVFVRGVNVDGVIAALKYVDWASLSNSKHYVDKDDKLGLQVFDFFRTTENQPNIYKENAAFKNIVRQALFGKYVETNETVKTLQGVELRLKHLGNKNSALLKQYLNVSSYPVVMAAGLWGDITGWQSLGQELADDGRDVWLAEITGGPNTECDSCADYTYQDLIDYHIPAIVGGVVEYSNSSRIQWVGHSNGGRSALDFLSAHSATGMNPAGLYWDGDSYEYDSFGANVVETYVGVGVPGAFEGDSPFSRCMKAHGDEMISKIPANQTHLSQQDLGRRLISEWPLDPYCVGIGLGMRSEDKISMSLTKQYHNWINNTGDTQPGSGISGLNTAKIIYGTLDLDSTTESDLIVPVVDDLAIYNNINAGNKYLNDSHVMHQDMINDPEVKYFIKEVITK